MIKKLQELMGELSKVEILILMVCIFGMGVKVGIGMPPEVKEYRCVK